MTITDFDDPVVERIILLNLCIYLTDIDPEKQILKLARRFQRESECKIMRNVMERIATYKGNRVRATIETYELLKSGNY